MPSHVALLRGINVGGRNRVAMANLRAVVAGLGHSDVATYIQSGNVVFSATETDPGTLAADLETAIAGQLGVRPRVVVLTRTELAHAVSANPYADEANPRLVHAIFLSTQPEPELVAGVAAAQEQAARSGGHDRVLVAGRTVYLHTPDGYGRSDLAAFLARAWPGAATGVAATARNWATVTKLLALLDG